MNDLQKLILDKVRTGMIGEGYRWEARAEDNEFDDDCDQWVMSIAIAPYDENIHKPWEFEDEEMREFYDPEKFIEEEGTPTHICRLVTRTRWHHEGYGGGTLDLVDGEDIYLIVDESEGTVKSIWEDLWNGDQPSYYGGPIPEAREWVNALPGGSGEFYVQLECPFE